MRTPCCLLSVSALLVGALALGNPFLPPRQTTKAAPSPTDEDRAPGVGRSGAVPLARRDPRAIAPFAVRAVWQDPRALPRRSPAWALQRNHLVLPRDVGHPAMVPASYSPPKVPGEDSGPQ